jgi:dsRNA-specific ribonuclease
MKRLAEAKVSEKTIRKLVGSDAVRELKQCNETEDILKLVCGELDIPLITTENAKLYPFAATSLVRWLSDISVFNGSCVIELVWPNVERWSDVIHNIQLQWAEELGNVEEKELLAAISEDEAKELGYVCAASFQMGETGFKFYGSLRMTKKAAAGSAAFTACTYLYRQKLLDEYLLPTKKKVMTKKIVSNCHPESVPKRCPKSFGKIDTNLLYLHLIKIEAKMEDSIKEPFVIFNHNQIAIATKGKIECDKIASFDIWISQTFRHSVQLINIGNEPAELNEMSKIIKFQKFIWNIAMNASNRIEKPNDYYSDEKLDYFILPMYNLNSAWQIDWDYINLICEDDKYLFLNQVTGKIDRLEDALRMKNITENTLSVEQFDAQLRSMVLTTKHNNIIYKEAELQHNIFSTDRFEKKRCEFVESVTYKNYFQSLGYENISINLATIRAGSIAAIKNCLTLDKTVNITNRRNVTLPQDVCMVLPVTARFVGYAQSIPSIIYYLQAHCQVQDFFGLISMEPISREIIFPAFFAASANNAYNYERLETLGDVFLKYAVSNYLFQEKDYESEGKLTYKRSKLVSNYNLHNICKKFRIDGMVELQPFHPNEFAPPNEIQKQARPRKISRKTQADFVEAIIGAFAIGGGEGVGYQFLIKCGLVQELIPVTITLNRKGFDNEHPVEATLNYKFNNIDLLFESLTHPSKSFGFNYERLEFLGDAVLDYLLMDYLYRRYPDASPGELSFLKSAGVNNESFCFMAVQLNLQEHIDATIRYIQSIKEYESFINQSQYFNPDLEGPKILADVFEALIGAIYLDSGRNLKQLWSCIYPLWNNFLDKHVTLDGAQENPLRMLYERIQEIGISSSYLLFMY